MLAIRSISITNKSLKTSALQLTHRTMPLLSWRVCAAPSVHIAAKMPTRHERHRVMLNMFTLAGMARRHGPRYLVDGRVSAPAYTQMQAPMRRMRGG